MHFDHEFENFNQDGVNVMRHDGMHHDGMHHDGFNLGMVAPEYAMDGCPDNVLRQEFDCGGDQRVIKHHHVVKHQHDIINEYDVVHEHTVNRYDVVRHRNVVRQNDMTSHKPDYCGDRCGCNMPRPPRPRCHHGRRRPW